MGSHYYIYAEVRVKDKWYSLNPIAKAYDGSIVLHPVYEGGSSLFNICNDLEDHKYGVGIPDDMSPELRSIYHDDLNDVCESWLPDTTWKRFYRQTIFCVRYDDAIAHRVIKDRPHKFSGYVNKRIIADFEVNEIEAIYSWLNQEQYDHLPEAKRQLYSYYEWNEEFDEYHTYRAIYERLCALLDWFSYADAFQDRGDYYEEPVSINDVRLFVERS